MSSPESPSLGPSGLPVVTEEVRTILESRKYNSEEAIRLMQESDPLAAELVFNHINGLGSTREEKVFAYETAGYLYALLSLAQKTENKS